MPIHNNAAMVRQGAMNYNYENKNPTSGYQVRLPKLSNQNKLNHE